MNINIRLKTSILILGLTITWIQTLAKPIHAFNSENECQTDFGAGVTFNPVNIQPADPLIEGGSTNSISVTISGLPAGRQWRIGVLTQWDDFTYEEASSWFSTDSLGAPVDSSGAPLVPSLNGNGVKVRDADGTKYLELDYAGGPGSSCTIGTFLINKNQSCNIAVAPQPSPPAPLPYCGDESTTWQITVTDVIYKGLPHSDEFLVMGNGKGQLIQTDSSGNAPTVTMTLPVNNHTLKVVTARGLEEICTDDQTIQILGNINSCGAVATPPPPAGTIDSQFPPFQPCPSNDPNCQSCLSSGGISTALGCISFNPSGFAINLYQIIFGIAGGAGFLLILYGTFLCITSQGNPQKAQACRETITSAIVGILMIIFSILIVNVIFGPSGSILPGLIPGNLFFGG